jgi:hypothetical protein
LSGAFIFKRGETDMGDKGSKDKGKREQQKKDKVSPKEKRKLKKEKKNNPQTPPGRGVTIQGPSPPEK